MLAWIFLLLSGLAWWVVFTTHSVLELTLALAAAVIFLVLGFFGLLSARVGQVTRTQGSREKALLLSTRPRPSAASARAGASDQASVTIGIDVGSTGRGGSRSATDQDGHADGGGDGGGGD
jgi:hypothetical protein